MLIILYSDKSIIGSELDIYIPDLRLAIEINGVTHYKPIYGKAQFDRSQLRDKAKMASCKELDISLLQIDVSKQIAFKEQTSHPFLEQIIDAIDHHLKLGAGVGVEPTLPPTY